MSAKRIDNGKTCESTDIAVSTNVTDLKFTSFVKAKKNIQAFAKRNTADFGLATVPSSGGLFGLGDHRVTGDELNNVTSQVQGHLVKINGVTTDLIKEFGQVYKALESLDKEYIPAILSAVKGAELASNKAKSAADHAKVAQEDIRKTVKEQEEIIKVLEDHKAKLDRLKHLESVDELWKASKELEQDAKSYKRNLDEARGQLFQAGESIKSIQRFMNGLLDYEHLDDIDEIWTRLGESEKTINSISIDLGDIRAGIKRGVNSIETINRHVNLLLSYEHLEEINIIWSDVQSLKRELSEIETTQKAFDERLNQQCSDLSETKSFIADVKKQIHLKDIDTLWLQQENAISHIEDINKKQNETDEEIAIISSIQEELKEFNTKSEKESSTQKEELELLKQELVHEKEIHLSDAIKLRKQIYVSCGIAGAAIILSALLLILNIVGVL